MPTYPWPETVQLAWEQNDKVAIATLHIPRRWPRVGRLLTVTAESAALAEHLAWIEYVNTQGRCKHHFERDLDDPSLDAGICIRCLSRFDHVMLDPATLSPSGMSEDDELTVESVLRQIDKKAATIATPQLYPTCRNPKAVHPFIAEHPALCPCHDRAQHEAGSFMDVTDALTEQLERAHHEEKTPAEQRIEFQEFISLTLQHPSLHWRPRLLLTAIQKVSQGRERLN